MARVSDDEVLLLWRALRSFRPGPKPRCAPRGRRAASSCPLYERCPRWHGQPDDHAPSLTETLAETERRRAAWPCSTLLDLLSPELTRIGPDSPAHPPTRKPEMPVAAPVPRGPSVLALGGAAELLTRPGCPVCRHTAEAGDRYLGWFAAEAHADPVAITRLCGSLGMCAGHTRSLMRQPGAAVRLTAVYRYVLEAAQGKLAGQGTRPALRPTCEHDQAAAGRTLDTLLDGLADAGIRERCQAAGGLCVPHVRAAARVRGYRRAVAWAADGVIARLGQGPPDLGLLAGGPDHDADRRAALRAALPPAGRVRGACRVCLAAARSEREALAGTTVADGSSRPGRAGGAGGRLPVRGSSARRGADGRPRAQDLLAGQARCARWLRGGPSRSPNAVSCPACRARASASRQELGRCGAVLAGPLRAGEGQPMLCVRHVLALRAADPGAARVAAEFAAEQAGALLCELTEAFRKSTWTYRHESMGAEGTAWRRGDGFLDGSVFGGCPPG